jgi:hypothetical protein
MLREPSDEEVISPYGIFELAGPAQLTGDAQKAARLFAGPGRFTKAGFGRNRARNGNGRCLAVNGRKTGQQSRQRALPEKRES